MNSFVVYKLGGSLLDQPDLVLHLRQVWQQSPESNVLLVVGGGAAVDVVREWDQNLQLGDEVAHWLAIDALDLSASLLEALIPELQLVRSLGQMRSAHAAGRPALLCVKCLVKWLETQPEPLPHSWKVTSDSIAAAVSRAWQADRLVLLKSCDLPEGANCEAMAMDGLVDEYFPVAAAGVDRIDWINLRAEPLVVTRFIGFQTSDKRSESRSVNESLEFETS